MITFLRHRLWPAFVILVALTLITGVVYPAVVTAIAQVVFPNQANGSMIVADGRTVGSSLIGQAFSDDKYFWGRRLRCQRIGRLAARADEPGPHRPHRRGGGSLASRERRRARPG
jgi:K+-transporting ATPase c subunit